MIVLAIDTVSPAGSVAIVDDDTVRAEYFEQSGLTHSTRLLSAVHGVLAGQGLTIDDLGGLALTAGPGSFTGVRVGVATIKGLSVATGLPIVPVGTLEAIARPLRFSSADVCCVTDARKGQVFTATYRPDGRGALAEVDPPASLTPEQATARLTAPVLFVGSGIALFEKRLATGALPGSLFADSGLWYSRASTVGLIAAGRLARGETVDAAGLDAIYVRPSEAEVHRGARRARG